MCSAGQSWFLLYRLTQETQSAVGSTEEKRESPNMPPRCFQFTVNVRVRNRGNGIGETVCQRLQVHGFLAI